MVNHTVSEMLNRPTYQLIDEEAVPEDFELLHKLLQTPIRRLHDAPREISGIQMKEQLRQEIDNITHSWTETERDEAFRMVSDLGTDFTDEPDALYSAAELWAYVHAVLVAVRGPVS